MSTALPGLWRFAWINPLISLSVKVANVSEVQCIHCARALIPVTSEKLLAPLPSPSRNTQKPRNLGIGVAHAGLHETIANLALNVSDSRGPVRHHHRGLAAFGERLEGVEILGDQHHVHDFSGFHPT